MKGKSFVFLLGLVFCFCALSSLAQVEEQKAQLYFFEEFIIKPSMIGEFEKVQKEWIVSATEHKYPYPWYLYNTDDLHYYSIAPLENYAGMDNIDKAWGEHKRKMGEDKWQAIMKDYFGTFQYYSSSFIMHRPDLSYTPVNPRLNQKEKKFVYINFFYIQPGREAEFERVLKEGVTFYKHINFPFAFDVYVGEAGAEMPMYIYLSKAENAANFHAEHDEAFKLNTEEAMKLRHKTFVTIRKIDVKTGMFRPDLSYMHAER